ncbi:MAG: hypothetical protein MUE46_05110 [Xanthomonadales bacterium]|nr:hypothetical protein [Xanthomonadales bacterium]
MLPGLAVPASAAHPAAAELLAGQYTLLEARLQALGGASDQALQHELRELALLTPEYREARQRWRADRPASPWPALTIGLSEARQAAALLEDREWHTLPPARRRAVLAAWASAATAYESAIRHRPALGPAHAGLLRLKRAGARGHSARALFERARQRAGASWSVLDEMLQTAASDPGVSRKTLEYLHGVSRRAAPRHPDFRALAATADCTLLMHAEFLDPEERRESQLAVPAADRSPDCQDQLAALARSVGDLATALRHAAAAEALQADDSRRLRIAALRATLAGPAAARDELAAAIDRHGPTPATLRRLASLHWQLGEDADALRILGLAVVWFPLDEAAWALRAQLLARQPEQAEAAAQSLATALRLDAGDAQRWSEWLRLQARLPCASTPIRFTEACAAWGCPDRVRRDPALNTLAKQLERRCG